MKYINLIWDFDGMLFNTYPRMATAFQQALNDLGVNASYEDVMVRIKRSVGRAAGDYAARFGLDRAALVERYQLREHAMPPETMIPYEGMGYLLQDAASAGCRHYLYTHRDSTAIEALERYGLQKLFSGMVTAMDHFPAKPAPDALISILTKYELDPKVSLMLGDRDIDIKAAQNAGISGCLFDPEHFYDGFENEMRTDSVKELRALLELD